MTRLSPELFERFQRLIYDQSSLRFSTSRLSNLETRIHERVAGLGLAGGEEYYDRLIRDREEFDRLIEGITTKETYFFRIPGHYQALREQVIPSWEEKLSSDQSAREGGRLRSGGWRIPFRVWSAGCATGEEPYSIAMTMMESLRFPRAWQVEVVASDISREAVRTASEGCYEGAALRRLPQEHREKYVRLEGERGRVDPNLKSKIRFQTFNLRTLPQGGDDGSFRKFQNLDGTSETVDLQERFHIIFCRNVMIYFDLEAQQRLVDGLYYCLKPGGCLFLGDAELLHIYRHGFQTREEYGSVFYQKPENVN